MFKQVMMLLVSARMMTTLPLSGNLIFWCMVEGMPPIGWNQGLPSSRAKVGGMSRIVNYVTNLISPIVTTALKVPTTSFLE